MKYKQKIIYVDPDHWKKLKMVAVKKGVSVSQIFRELAKEFLIKEGVIEEEKPVI